MKIPESYAMHNARHLGRTQSPLSRRTYTRDEKQVLSDYKVVEMRQVWLRTQHRVEDEGRNTGHVSPLFLCRKPTIMSI